MEQLIFEMKNFAIALLIVGGCISSGCNRQYSREALENYVVKGYIPFDYIFSDSGKRNLRLKFLTDSTLAISNRVTKEHAPTYYLYNFDVIYSYKPIEMGVIKILEPLNDNKVLDKGNYIKPYNKGSFVSIESVFPDIEGDSIFFSNDFKKIQIKEFSFDLAKAK